MGLAIHADQPIVENYVGRQVPTAMVARNLARGSGFLHPTLDTGPSPNEFLVEPPIYAQLVVGVAAGIGFVWRQVDVAPLWFGWEIPGRLTSAGLTTLGAWAFYGLVRRREGPVVALVALGSFGILPVTLRYGRAFQPDAAMLGFVLLGLRGWDEFQGTGRRRWAVLGGVALATGLAIKATAAWALIPFALIVSRTTLARRLVLGGVMVIPALLWYAHAWQELRPRGASAGSLAAADNAAIWAGSLSPASWLRFATWEAIARNLGVRAFTPLGTALAAVGFVWRRPTAAADRCWLGWGLGVGASILALAAKWHHGYYWLALAPLVAVGVARALVGLAGAIPRGRIAAAGLGSLLVGLAGYQARATWRTPPEWAAIGSVRDRIGGTGVPDVRMDGYLIAPEAVIFYADRPGYRLEFGPDAVRRAAGECGGTIAAEVAARDPLALVDFYVRRFATPPRTGPVPITAALLAEPRYVADVGLVAADPRRAAFREALRRRPRARILIDDPDFLFARLE